MSAECKYLARFSRIVAAQRHRSPFSDTGPRAGMPGLRTMSPPLRRLSANVESMDSSRQTTILFADVSGGSKLYEAADYAAAIEVIARCIERVRDAAQSAGGQVVKTNGDKVMVLFPTPDAAAHAATRMHATIEALPGIGGTKLGVQVGFHSGPVYRCDEDLLGDTVKLASRMVEQAQKGQTITSQQTAALLSPSFRALSRQLDAIQAREKGEGLRLCEIALPAVTGFRRLRLTYRDLAIVCSRENESVVVGRAPGCATAGSCCRTTAPTAPTSRSKAAPTSWRRTRKSSWAAAAASALAARRTSALRKPSSTTAGQSFSRRSPRSRRRCSSRSRPCG